jgi:hypothetical protein
MKSTDRMMLEQVTNQVARRAAVGLDFWTDETWTHSTTGPRVHCSSGLLCGLLFGHFYGLPDTRRMVFDQLTARERK